MAVIPVTFAIADAALPFGTPLDAVVVRVYNESGDTFITEGDTDETGEVILLLEDMTTFWVRFFKVGFKFATRLRITADSTATSNTFDVVGEDLTELPPSAVPELCRASGWVLNAAGAPTPGAMFSFNATDLPKIIGGRAVVRSKVITVSDKDGYVEVELARGGVYDAVVEGSEDQVVRVKVPEQGAVNITDLVWPFVAVAEFNPAGSINLSVDEEIEVDLTVILSSGVRTPFDLDGPDRRRFGFFVNLRSTEGVVADITVDENTDKLIITGKSVGTTTLEVTLREDEDPAIEVKRLPPPIRDLKELIVIVT